MLWVSSPSLRTVRLHCLPAAAATTTAAAAAVAHGAREQRSAEQCAAGSGFNCEPEEEEEKEEGPGLRQGGDSAPASGTRGRGSDDVITVGARQIVVFVAPRRSNSCHDV